MAKRGLREPVADVQPRGVHRSTFIVVSALALGALAFAGLGARPLWEKPLAPSSELATIWRFSPPSASAAHVRAHVHLQPRGRRRRWR